MYICNDISGLLLCLKASCLVYQCVFSVLNVSCLPLESFPPLVQVETMVQADKLTASCPQQILACTNAIWQARRQHNLWYNLGCPNKLPLITMHLLMGNNMLRWYQQCMLLYRCTISLDPCYASHAMPCNR